jgi:predicted CoA-binding protein
VSRSIDEILQQSTVVAVVGASEDLDKPGHRIPVRLQKRGFKLIPVNPKGGELFGETVYRSLTDVDVPVDVVDVFRPADEAPEIALQAAAIRAKALWLQEGLTSEKAKQIATDAGMDYAEDICMAGESDRLDIQKD